MNVHVEEPQAGRIEISVPQDITVKELDHWQLLLSQLLALAFQSRRVGLVTIDPQRYSLGYEIEGYTLMHADGKPILINIIAFPSLEILQEIARSEEFNRGLLRTFATNAISPANLSEANVLEVISGRSSQEAPRPMLFCDDDGRILYWIDLQAPVQQIQEAISAVME